ncbi:hypothetical protein Hanom_Chr10g00942691 [Helianthus anomalus]
MDAHIHAYKTYNRNLNMEAVSLFIRGRGEAFYILPSSVPILVVLLVGFTEYDDDEDKRF